jgi:uncharacterized membrane protein
MAKGLKDGMIPVRWSMDLGYGFGYPIFNFYDPLPYYVGGVIEVIGLNALLATKTMMAIGIMLSGISMYFLAKEFWGKSGGVFSALLYMYAPYHALDIYVRGDVAEFWAYAFVPLVFLGLWKIYKENKWRYVVLAAVSFALVVISHNLTAMMISPFVVVFALYLAFKARNKKTLFHLGTVFIIGALLSAFYWLPAILEMQYTNVNSLILGGSNFRDHFVCLSQLWTSPWGFGGSTKGCVDGLSFMLGKYHILLSLFLSIFALLALGFRKYFEVFSKDKLIVIVFAFVGILISTFLTLQISQPVWELIRPMSFFQYPWRFLLTGVFFASFISGSIFWVLEKYLKKNVLIIIVLFLVSCFLILVSAKFFVPQHYLLVNSNYYTNTDTLKWTTSKISDEYLPKNFPHPKNSTEIASFSNLNSKNITVENINLKTQRITFDIIALSTQGITVPLAYFPSWQGYVDGKQVVINDNLGKVAVNIPKGQHSVSFIFKESPVELIADFASLAGILALFIGIIQLSKKYA